MNPISVHGLRRSYGEAVALASLDLEVGAGECVALLGHNGSGKTTALTSIVGLAPPSAGTVRIASRDPFSEPSASVVRRALAYVSDSPIFYADMTVTEHVEMVGIGHGVATRLGKERFYARCDRLIGELGLDGHREHVPDELSAGLQQRTQLACAFIRPFKVLVLDEPVLRLDPAAQTVLARRLVRARERGAAILLSTHSSSFAQELADRVVLLQRGEVVATGSYDQIRATPEAGLLGLT